ncbi:hypothetical protein [Ottowia sp.]|uniref:hypothetical protein n=1 Tax=Ottowia sp. TaxID=1898956 RepID=UPI0039E3A45C
MRDIKTAGTSHRRSLARTGRSNIPLLKLMEKNYHVSLPGPTLEAVNPDPGINAD